MSLLPAARRLGRQVGGQTLCRPRASGIIAPMSRPPDTSDQQVPGVQKIVVPVRVMPEAEGLELPRYETAQSAGMDLRAALADQRGRQVVIEPGQRALVSTGLRIALPSGFEAQVRPRSGLAVKHGVTVLNSPGTVDADYRGTIKVALINLGDEPFVINHGERIAQLIVAPVRHSEWQVVPELSETARGVGGFGSTGQ